MSIANVHREPVHNADGDIVGVNISADVVNTGPVPIISPFIMTWRLRTADSEEIARATHRFTQFDAGQVQKIALTMAFAPRSSLSGVQNVVTFDFEESRGGFQTARTSQLTTDSPLPDIVLACILLRQTSRITQQRTQR